jgi:hypothetical protein
MDEFYNERFAKQVERAVARMDDDEAEMFVRFAAYEIHKADIDANQRLISKRVEQIHAEIQRDVAKALASTVSKGLDVPVDEVVTLVDEIAKGKKSQRRKAEREELRQLRQWREESVRRDAAGRFTFENGKPGSNVHVKAFERDFNLTGSLNSAQGRGNSFQEKWNAPGDNETAFTNKRTYDRIAAGAELLQGSGNPKLEAAAQMGRFAGRFGPEAEKVVGPHLRKTAYRYRGTERRPDPALLNTHEQVTANMARHDGLREVDDTTRVAAAQRTATGYLMSKLPAKRLATLQQASGKIPPSQGVIINEEGTIVTQAVGHADDHYLPFNLKNLKGLQGGHYVRSRSQGGLTTEDIYTGLVSGARSVTVVSRSGVFTINFEDDFRGGRRYNDKARAMIGQYAHTLDAVQSQQVAQRKLSPEERAEIRDEVEREHADLIADGALKRSDLEEIIGEREMEYLTRPTLTKVELAEIDALARKDNDDERKYRVARSELISRKMEEKSARNYRLDGEGYKAALEALEEQFPYYIASVEAKTRSSTQSDNPFTAEEDKGYVMPKYNRPAGAMAGYFDEEINGRTKVPANQTQYQNWAHNELNSRTKAAPKGEGVEGDTKPKDKKDERLKLREAGIEGKRQKQVDDAIKQIVSIYGQGEGVKPILSEATDDEALRAILKSRTRREELMTEIKRVHGLAQRSTDDATKGMAKEAEIAFRTIKHSAVGATWSGKEHAASPDAPFRFDGNAYSPAAPADLIRRTYRDQAAKAGLKEGNLEPGGMSDGDLRDNAALYGFIGEAVTDPEFDKESFMRSAVAMGAEVDTAEVIANNRGRYKNDAKRLKALAKFYLDRSEAFHRARSLKANLEQGGSKPEVQRATGTIGFAGTTGGGTTRGNLVSLPTPGTNLKDSAHQTDDVVKELRKFKASLSEESDNRLVVNALIDRIHEYQESPASERSLDNADWEEMVRDLTEILDGMKDEDVRGKLDTWLLSRKLNRPREK